MGRHPSIPGPETVGITKPEDFLRRYVGDNAKRALAVIQMDANTELKPFGLRMVTFSALVIIAKRPALRQADLSEALTIERSNVVPIIDELEELCFVERRRPPADRRAYALHATLTGQKIAQQATEALDARAPLGSVARRVTDRFYDDDDPVTTRIGT